jgi:hypothetical protein
MFSYRKKSVPDASLGDFQKRKKEMKQSFKKLFMVILTLVFMLMLAGPAYAAPGSHSLHANGTTIPLNNAPTLTWNTFLGGSADFEGSNSVAVDGNGNVYLTGNSEGTWGTPIRAYSGGYDAFVAKLDSSGNLLWNTFLGQSDYDGGDSIAVDVNGNVYVTGRSNDSWGSPLQAYSASGDVFVAKLDTNGTITWNTFVGGSGSDYGQSIAVDGNGNLYVGGYSDMTWGNPVRAHTASTEDAFAAKLDASSGALTWNTFLGGSGGDEGKSIAVDGSGNVYMAGWSNATWGSPIRSYSSDLDAFAAKMDSSGALTWNTFLGQSLYDEGKSIAVDGSGNVYMTGWSAATWGSPVRAFTLTPPNPPFPSDSADAFAVKLDSSGALTWNTFLGGTSFDYGYSITINSGNVFVAGTSGGTWGSPTHPFDSNSDAYIAKLTSSGNLTWNTFLGGTGADDAQGGFLAVSNGNVYVTGYSTATWGNPVRAFTSADNAFVAKVADPAPLPSPWIGSVSITSDKNVVAVGRPHIGTQVASYNGTSAGSRVAYLPMLFKDAFAGGGYDSAFYIENVDSLNTATIDIYYVDSEGNATCTVLDETIAPLASKGYWLPGISATCLPSGWVGGVTVVSDYPIVAIGRPHINGEVMTYNGFSSGSTTSYLPMLFKNAFAGGAYKSAFYVQNVDDVTTSDVEIRFYDNTGALSCTIFDTIEPLAAKGYWVPAQTCLDNGWVGGVVVYSSTDVVTVGRPHIGTEITTYTGVSSGALTSYVPMLFKKAFSGGTYNSAVYVQNNDGTTPADLTFDFYDSAGTLICSGTGTVAPWAVVGYWIPSTTCLPDGWAGGVVITSNVEIVAVGRPHIGTQVTTYNGFTSGSLTSFLPMLFKDAFASGSYDAAFYIQNTESTAAAVTIEFYDGTGALTCTRNDTIAPFATQGLWSPTLSCLP